jgi:hypoxanthine phosphoribosyltransferase
MITVKSITDLNLAIVQNLHLISKLGIDLIVGIPRSGLIAATLISTHLQKPLTDLESYISGRAFYKSGQLFNTEKNNFKILLVDDTINQGTQMRAAVQRLNNVGYNHNVIRFAVYISNKTKLTEVDLFCETCVNPRAFQWNIWKHPSLSKWATDMDGVLCRDPVWKIENDRGPKLIEFYKNADKKFELKEKVKYIITSRLDTHRSVTEDWLDKNNIKYENLIMKPASSKLRHEEYKLGILKSIKDVELYIESDTQQARFIAESGNIPVWCIDSQTTYYPKK